MTDPTILRTLGRAVSRESAGRDSTVGVPDAGTGCGDASGAGDAACAPLLSAGCTAGGLRIRAAVRALSAASDRNRRPTLKLSLIFRGVGRSGRRTVRDGVDDACLGRRPGGCPLLDDDEATASHRAAPVLQRRVEGVKGTTEVVEGGDLVGGTLSARRCRGG